MSEEELQRWQRPGEPDIVHQAEPNPVAACRGLSPRQPAVCVPLLPGGGAGCPIGASLNTYQWYSYMSYTCSQWHLRETSLSFPRFGLGIFLLLHFILFFSSGSPLSQALQMPSFALAAFSICLFQFPSWCCQMKNNSGQEVHLSDVLKEQP